MRLAHKHAGISALAGLEPRARAAAHAQPPVVPTPEPAAPQPRERRSLRRLARTR